MEMKIEDKECWICGFTQNITYHHTLPLHWKPKKNVVVPICGKCHDRLNQEDLAGLQRFACKMQAEFGRQMSMMGALRNNIEKYFKMNDAIMKAMKKKSE